MCDFSLQEGSSSETQNGHSVLREQLVSNQVSSTSQRTEGIEETLGSLTLDEIDQPSTSAES